MASKRLAAGLLMGTGCLFLGLGVGASEAAPVPRSTLVSKPELPFTLSISRRPGEQITVLMYQPAGGEPLPVARITTAGAHVSIERLPLGRAEPDLDIAILERLYVLALRQEAEAKFCLAGVGQRCDPAKDGYSHADLLRSIVAARQSALDKAAGRGVAGRPWRVITMSPSTVEGGTADHVAIRVTAEGRPMEGVTIYFNRAPHSSCAAKANAEGVATCKLVDQHGDEDSDHEPAAVLATYPGEVRPDLVRVPMTLVFAR